MHVSIKSSENIKVFNTRRDCLLLITLRNAEIAIYVMMICNLNNAKLYDGAQQHCHILYLTGKKKNQLFWEARCVVIL